MVMIRQAERPYTADDLAEMPDDGRRYEVLGGELIVSPSPSPRHQGVLLRLAKVIDDYVEGERWGSLYTAPLDVHPGPHDIVQPDLVAVSRDHLGRVENRGRLWRAGPCGGGHRPAIAEPTASENRPPTPHMAFQNTGLSILRQRRSFLRFCEKVDTDPL